MSKDNRLVKPPAVVLPSVWQNNNENNEGIHHITSDQIPSTEEIIFRDDVKNFISERSVQEGITPFLAVISMAPITVELLLDHVKPDNYDKAVADIEAVFGMFFTLAKDERLKGIVTNGIDSSAQGMDW